MVGYDRTVRACFHSELSTVVEGHDDRVGLSQANSQEAMTLQGVWVRLCKHGGGQGTRSPGPPSLLRAEARKVIRTAMACETTGRDWIGIELSRRYCDISENAIAAVRRKR